MNNQYYVYILSNFTKNVIYVGVTNDLVKRVWQHKNNVAEGYTKKYNVHNLVYYEILNDPTSAIEREKQIKSWSRKKKDSLIKILNPKLEDLYQTIV